MKDKDPVLNESDRQAFVQSTIRAFISADILHRKTIEEWAADAGIHRSGHRMLMHLTRCETTPTQKDIANHFDISPAAVAVTLKKLESDGYIERGKCGERTDSRFNEIKITERGRDIALASRKYFQHVDSEAFKDFTVEELTVFSSMLERMQNNLKNVTPIFRESDEIEITTRKE